jgi:hypothetical protein
VRRFGHWSPPPITIIKHPSPAAPQGLPAKAGIGVVTARTLIANLPELGRTRLEKKVALVACMRRLLGILNVSGRDRPRSPALCGDLP